MRELALKQGVLQTSPAADSQHQAEMQQRVAALELEIQKEKEAALELLLKQRVVRNTHSSPVQCYSVAHVLTLARACVAGV
jgi:hypothetical protein